MTPKDYNRQSRLIKSREQRAEGHEVICKSGRFTREKEEHDVHVVHLSTPIATQFEYFAAWVLFGLVTFSATMWGQGAPEGGRIEVPLMVQQHGFGDQDMDYFHQALMLFLFQLFLFLLFKLRFG